jgi:hypothetical protein
MNAQSRVADSAAIAAEQLKTSYLVCQIASSEPQGNSVSCVSAITPRFAPCQPVRPSSSRRFGPSSLRPDLLDFSSFAQILVFFAAAFVGAGR